MPCKSKMKYGNPHMVKTSGDKITTRKTITVGKIPKIYGGKK